MREAARKHRENQQVRKLYDVLLKLTKESKAKAGKWKVLQRWSPHYRCSIASRRDTATCFHRFIVDTMVITKSCNVSTTSFFEAVLDTQQHRDSDKYDELIQRCRASLPESDDGTNGTFSVRLLACGTS